MGEWNEIYVKVKLLGPCRWLHLRTAVGKERVVNQELIANLGLHVEPDEGLLVSPSPLPSIMPDTWRWQLSECQGGHCRGAEALAL